MIGLTVAVCLAERGHHVEVRTDREPAQTTSAVASAMIGPAIAPPDSQVGSWERASVEQFTTLSGVDPTGVTIRRGRLVDRDAAGPAPPGDLLACDEVDLPAGFAVGYWATLPLVDMVPYLDYLTTRLTAAGGHLQLRGVASLGELADKVELMVNCAGMGAQQLAGDESLSPVFGQHVIVENPGVEEFFVEAPFTPEWTAYWPYPNHVVIGGVARRGYDSIEPDLEISERMLQRCVAVEPRFSNVRVLGHQVGLRPTRPTPRLEVEMIGSSRCVHSYGHGGSGVTHSWGAAFAAADLLLGE